MHGGGTDQSVRLDSMSTGADVVGDEEFPKTDSADVVNVEKCCAASIKVRAGIDARGTGR